MTKTLLSSIMCLMFITLYAQNAPSPQKNLNVPRATPKIILIDTVFGTMGVKFGYPKDYKVSVPGNNPNYMEMWSKDSLISITINSGSAYTYAEILSKWAAKDQKAKPDYWHKNIGKIATTDYSRKQPFFLSQYIYPYNFGGAEFILIELKTNVVGKGLAELETVKASVKRSPVPMIVKPIGFANLTMGIPAYMARESNNGTLSTFRGANAVISFHNSSLSESFSYVMDAESHKEQQVNNGFKVWGKISTETSAGISFYGYFGEGFSSVGKSELQGFAFFSTYSELGETEGRYVKYRLIGGNSFTMETDMKEFLQTMKTL